LYNLSYLSLLIWINTIHRHSLYLVVMTHAYIVYWYFIFFLSPDIDINQSSDVNSIVILLIVM
jgi:hypothetical protein